MHNNYDMRLHMYIIHMVKCPGLQNLIHSGRTEFLSSAWGPRSAFTATKNRAIPRIYLLWNLKFKVSQFQFILLVISKRALHLTWDMVSLYKLCVFWKAICSHNSKRVMRTKLPKSLEPEQQMYVFREETPSPRWTTISNFFPHSLQCQHDTPKTITPDIST